MKIHRDRGRDRVLKSEWMLAVEFVETARIQLSGLNFTTSLDLCDRALRVSPNYYPAMELRKKICEAQRLIGVSSSNPSGTVVSPFLTNKFNSKSEGDLRGVGVGGELFPTPTPRFTSTPNRECFAGFSKVSRRLKLNRDRDQHQQAPQFSNTDYFGGEIKSNKHVHWAKNEPIQQINKIKKTAAARPNRNLYLSQPQKQSCFFQNFQYVLYCIYYFIFYLVKNSFEFANTVYYEMRNFLYFLIDVCNGNYQNKNFYAPPGTGRRGSGPGLRELTREIGINSTYSSGNSTQICWPCKALLREQFLVPIRIEIIGCPHCRRVS